MSFRVRENVSETYNVSVDGLKSSFTVYKGIVKKYEWEGPLGEDGNLSVKFSQNLYNYYRGLSHVAYETEDSLKFVTYRENVIQTIANKLGGVYADPEKETNYILSFVQKCFPYTLESEEYWRYPVETLVDNGDCEDKAFLFASVMKAAGHDVCLIVFDNHMMVGVVLPDPPTYATRGEVHWFESEGKKYYTCETTGEGWRGGDIPESYEGESAEILVVE